MRWDLSTIFLTFIIYSVIGYILEIIVCSFSYKKIVNRGFFFGPWCPIYGIGALLIILTLSRYKYNIALVFIFGILITSTIEYYTSYLLEKIFHNKWWDYSNRKDSINGRICVGNMIGFGFGSCAIIYISQPLIMSFLGLFHHVVLNIIAIIIAILFIADCIYSFIIAYTLRNRIIVAEELKAAKVKLLPVLFEKKFKGHLKNINIKKIRYFRAFPNLKTKYDFELGEIKKWLEDNSKKNKKKKKSSKKN